MALSARERERLLEQVKRLRWVHCIDLGDGVVTPGLWKGHNPHILKAFDTIDFRGKKVLDIGCWDGLFSFEAEKRGASEVYATDLVDQRRFIEDPCFVVAKKLLQSKAKYFPNVSVQDVETLGVRDFDVVIYAGVYYHVRDPLRSFAMLRRVMKEGAVLLVEGAAIPSDESYARFYYREPYLCDHSNWWIPTIGCVREWVECSFFATEREFGAWNLTGKNTRFTMTARAVRRADPLYIRPEQDLARFDLNTYPRNFDDPVAEVATATRHGRLIRHLPSFVKSGPLGSRLRRIKQWVEGRTGPGGR